MIFCMAGAGLIVALIVFMTRRFRRREAGLQVLSEEASTLAAHPEQNVQLGIRAFMKGRYHKAFQLLEPAGHQGSLRAQQLLAKMYYAGNGVTADREKYLYWLGLAAANGDKPSMIKLKRAKSREGATHSKSIDS